MRPKEREMFLDRFVEVHPYFRGANVSDILSILDEHDSDLGVVEPMIQEHPEFDAMLVANATRVVFHVYGEVSWPHVLDLIERVQKMAVAA